VNKDTINRPCIPGTYTVKVEKGPLGHYSDVEYILSVNFIGNIYAVITYNANGGTVSPASATTTAGGNLSILPTPKRNGYSFNGWYMSKTGGEKITTSTVFIENTTVYAQWTSVTKFKLGDVDGNGKVQIADALEIFKYLAGMKNKIKEGGRDSNAWRAALITPASQKSGKPAIGDALEILKNLAGMKSLIT
jgi:uncharacterized repeat protein (TIGR02543 family)